MQARFCKADGKEFWSDDLGGAESVVFPVFDDPFVPLWPEPEEFERSYIKTKVFKRGKDGVYRETVDTK